MKRKVSSFCFLWAFAALKYSCTSNRQGAAKRVPLLQQAAPVLCIQWQSLSESHSSTAGFFLSAAGVNPQSKLVQRLRCPLALLCMPLVLRWEYFILTCTSVFHFVAFCTKCLSLMNAWNALLWTPPPEPSKQHLLSSASSRSHLHPRTAGVLG